MDKNRLEVRLRRARTSTDRSQTVSMNQRWADRRMTTMFSLHLLTSSRPKGQLHSIYQSIKQRQKRYFLAAQGLRSARDYGRFTFHRANFRLNLPVNSERKTSKDLIRPIHKSNMSRRGSFTRKSHQVALERGGGGLAEQRRRPSEMRRRF